MSALSPRRRLAAVMAGVLAAGLLAVVPAAPAAAAGPSVDPPGVPSVPVTPVGMAPLVADQASLHALSGNQQGGGSPPPAGGGTPAATSLAPSASWSVSGHTGDFHWSYPLRMPPVPGGLAPDLALSYRSSAVDGRTSVTNNQPSWIGDGWDLNAGFVERSYGACALDKEGGTAPQTSDLCWRSDNATAMYGGGGGTLILDPQHGWRPQEDDGSTVERLTGSGNGARDGEYWKITTLDGTQYFFGSRPAANSTWTVPVYGDDNGEPCKGATFATSRCTQAWRWNLDKIVDPRGNLVLLGYQTETNSYAANLGTAAVSYVRGGTLRRIEYGLHTDVPGLAPARVEFTVAGRCVPGSNCSFDQPANWPDTPLSERCEAATCPGKNSPSFWSTNRLSSVTTQVLRDGAYADVDRWTLDQQYPDPGTGEKAALWLKSITHTGLAGGSAALPPVTFEGTQLPNRVHQGDNLSPIVRYRITGIVSESGGVISVHYADPECVPGRAMPANAHTNTMRCFPVRWNQPGHAERTDWFHKYVVESIIVSDRVNSSLDEQFRYEYLDGAGWRFDRSEFTPQEKKTWNDFRGFGRVRIHHGRPGDPAGPVSMSEQRFYRGMLGDHLPGNATRPSEVRDSEGGVYPDHDWLQGFPFESTSFLGESGGVVNRTITEPVWVGPTATRGPYQAYRVRPGTVRTYTPLEEGRRVTRVVTTYDSHGMTDTVSDLGDVDDPADDLCTDTEYLTRGGARLPARVETVSVACGTAPTFPRDAVSGERLTYDDRGNVTEVAVLEERPAAGPVYTTTAVTDHDIHGRPVRSEDALGRASDTTYTPAEGGPLTGIAVTDPMGFTTTTTLDPRLGLPLDVTDENGNVTSSAYDPLGRVSEVWLQDRPRQFGFPSSYRFSYQVTRDAANVVTTTRISANDTYVSTNSLYDGQLRLRQVQAPAPGGGRLLADTRYDSQGRAYQTTNPYFNNAPVDGRLWEASDVDIPGLTVTQFDGAGRPAVTTLQAGGVDQWRSTVRYGGDRTHYTPPAGGIPATTVTDARGRTIELHQYEGAAPTGPAGVTRYTHTPAGGLDSLTDPAGNVWRYEYDLLGRQIEADDPDKGVSTFTYDDAGQLESMTDARGQRLEYTYDDLGRRLAVESGGTAGRVLAEWTYDTVPFGKGWPATATSYDQAGNPFTTSVLEYTARYQPRRAVLTVPASEGLLAGSYRFSWLYKPDGSLAGESYPAAGGLFAEEVFHTYDDFGRPLTTRGGPVGSTVTYASGTDYTRLGELQRLQLGTGSKRAWLTQIYDGPDRRVARTIVDAELPRPMQADLHYRYDPAGNLLSIEDKPIDRPVDRQCFDYDHLRRLTEAWTPASSCTAAPSVGGLAGPAPYWQSFTYDDAGNRLTEVRHAVAGDTTRTYDYPDAGQDLPHALMSLTSARPGQSETVAYDYDEAGNTTLRGDQQLDWDEFGRLASATRGGGDTSYVYGAGGERLLRREPGATTLYLGSQEVRLDHATGTRTGTRYYAHGGAVIAVRTGAGLSWLFTDHHGTAQVALDAASQTATIRRHDPFGNPRGTQPPSWPGERGFIGGVMDTSTGLTHLGAREYDPGTGRFISVDPVLDPGDPQQFHAYAYANNNPVSMSDPTGLRTWADDSGRWFTVPPGPVAAPPPPPSKPWCNYHNCASRNDTAAEQGALKVAKALNKPATGKKPDPRHIRDLRTFHNYRGSEWFTYADAAEFAMQGPQEFFIVCQTLGISGGACTQDTGSPILTFIGDLVGINDIVDCIDGNWDACISAGLGFTPVGKAAKLAEGVTDAARGAAKSCHSFRPDTEVRMADGTQRPIGEVELGDEVLATDPESGRTEPREVVALHTNTDHELATVEVTTSEGTATLHTTANHPFWSDSEDSWIEAGDLTAGDLLVTPDGRHVTVSDVLVYAGEQVMHDLTVETTHTYYVAAGEDAVLVHNCDPTGIATVHWYDEGHASIDVRANADGHMVSTHLIGMPGEVTYPDEWIDFLTPIRSIELKLDHAIAAQLYQENTLGRRQGMYDLKTNSCVTYCGDVLRVGGLDVPSRSIELGMWLFRNGRVLE